jgi:hypothetical protein
MLAPHEDDYDSPNDLGYWRVDIEDQVCLSCRLPDRPLCAAVLKEIRSDGYLSAGVFCPVSLLQADFICNELDLTDEQALYLLHALNLLPEGAPLPERVRSAAETLTRESEAAGASGA